MLEKEDREQNNEKGMAVYGRNQVCKMKLYF
jgi:hypothetical protein